METSSTKKKWLRWLLLAIVAMAVAGGAVFYYVMNAEFADTSSEKPAYTISAMDLLAAFQQNDSAANKKYTEQIVAVGVSLPWSGPIPLPLSNSWIRSVAPISSSIFNRMPVAKPVSCSPAIVLP